MKISIDNILGSARKIKSQRHLDDDSSKKKKELKIDSVSINNKIASRIDKIDNEIKDIQVSITKNQIINNGIIQLQNDHPGTEETQQNIMKNVLFQDEKVLSDFIGSVVTVDVLKNKKSEIDDLISKDVSNLKKLQIELDNIMSLNLGKNEKLENIMSNIDSLFAEKLGENVNNISRLRPDTVMRLLK